MAQVAAALSGEEAQQHAAATTPEAKPSPSLSVRVRSGRPLGIGLDVTSKRWMDKLEKLDVNHDGVIDAAEVVALVDEMAKDQAMLKLYRFVTIGLFIVVGVLIGALTGITYGIVQLSKDTKVTNFNSNYQLMATKDNKPAISGGAMLDLSSLSVLPHDQRPNLTELAAATDSGGRRRLAATSEDLNLLTYYGSVKISTVEEGCNLLRFGLSKFLVSTAGSGALGGGSRISSISIAEQVGCNAGDNVDELSALIQVDQAMTFLILCGVAKGSCDAFYHQDSLVQDGYEVAAGDNSTTGNTPSSRRSAIFIIPALVSVVRVLPTLIRIANTIADNIQTIMKVANCAQYANSGASTCCYICDSGYTKDSKSCDCIAVEVACFPAEASVEVLGRGTVRMADLQYGDLVRSLDRSTRTVVHRPVYLFGHRERGGVLPYVHITAAGRTLAATEGHFVPVCVGRCTAEDLAAGAAVIEDRRAGNVRVGDVLIVDSAPPAFTPIESVDILLATGAFNPYVRGADIIVDGVVASPHSDWLLDPVAPAWAVRHLPAIYEALLAPVYGLYYIAGPATVEWFAQDLSYAKSGLEPTGYLIVVAGLSAPLVAAAALLVYAVAKWQHRH